MNLMTLDVVIRAVDRTGAVLRNLGRSTTTRLSGANAAVASFGGRIGTATTRASNAINNFTNRANNRLSNFGVRTGVAMGVASSVTTTAMNAISSSIGSAVDRVDLLNNFPRVMESMGFSADEASTSIKGIMDHLTGLPTATQDMVGFVQQLAATTGSLDTATDVALAFNDMVLSSGASTTEASNAMTQYNQMLAAGKVDQQAWNSVVTAAPGQIKQLAQELLGAGANQKDLYTALQEGTLSLDDMNAAMIKLDSEGGEGFASFSEQAKAATGGIGTAWDNVKNRITQAVAKVIEAIGSDNIAEAIDTFSSSFDGIADKVVGAIEFIKEHIEIIKPIVAGLAAAFAAFQIISMIAGLITSLGAAFSFLLSPIGLVSIAIAGVVALIVAFATNAGGCRDTVINAWNSICEFFGSLPEKIGGFLQGVVDRINEWASGISEKAREAGSNFATTINNFFSQLPGKIWGFLSNAISKITTFASNIKQKATSAASGFLTRMVNGIKSLPGRIWGFLSKVISKAASFVTSFGNKAANAARSFATKLINGIKSLPGKVVSIGGDIINGLANGIKNGAHKVIEALGGVVTSAVEKAKKLLHINSPSKVFRDIGVYTMEGFELGVNNGAGSAIASVQNAMRGVVDTATGTSISARVNANTSSGTSIGELHVHVDSIADVSQWQSFVTMLKRAKAMA